MDKNTDLEEKHDIEAGLADPASFHDNKVLEVSSKKKNLLSGALPIIIFAYRRKISMNLKIL